MDKPCSLIRAAGWRWKSSLVGRLAAVVGLEFGLVILWKSPLAAGLIGRPYVPPLYFGPSPLVALAVLAATFAGCSAPAEANAEEQHGASQTLVAWGLLTALLVAVSYLTHPIAGAADIWQSWPPVGRAALGAVKYSLLIACAAPLALLMCPWSSLQRAGAELAWGLLLVIGYTWLGVAEIALHKYVAPLVLQRVARLLSVVSSVSVAQHGVDGISFGPVAVIIGPECLGLDSLSLFAALAAFVIRRNQRCGLPITLLWTLFCGGGLLALNVGRIAAILLVGMIAPERVLSLFHSILGLALFAIVGGLYVGGLRFLSFTRA